MKKKIDSTFYFFQHLISRIIPLPIIGFLIYSLIILDIKSIIASSIFLAFSIFILKRQVPKPTDLCFDEKFLHLDSQSNPIEIKYISAIENGVLLYNIDGKTSKVPLPNYYFIDKNYKELKKIIERNSTNAQKSI